MTTGKKKTLKSDIALIETDKITIHGLDLARDILGKLNLGDMAFLEMMGRIPTAQESAVFNAIAVALAEHGVSANAIVARMTYTGAPEAMQAAIAAGLLGMGGGMTTGAASGAMKSEARKTGSMENAARMLQEAIPDRSRQYDLDAIAHDIVAQHAESQVIPGIGHHFHLPRDPRSARLFEIARTNGFDGPYIKLMQLIEKYAQESYKQVLPVNAPGAIAAVACELGLPWQVVRGVSVVARAIGLVGHILEEMKEPMSREIQTRAQEEATTHLKRR
jgi:citrate synthase